MLSIIIFFYIVAVGLTILDKIKGVFATIIAIPVLPFMFTYYLFFGNEQRKQEAKSIFKFLLLSTVLFLIFCAIFSFIKYTTTYYE